ncbi:hypothetical protein DCAR_0727340 [Daucus carota subsp. sativus]|uniref:Uncharacterized protein n=1 Tax=Daucus carota subsp. sativus TaxID=79200 RepID=A0AAF0XK44_DAUCS|nr:PREDICTED: uncharacterized protein LOC108193192 [Daucus carota subsp. sativus]WOH07906.1 hypothetical protein DCAR_0727340 [Daucus carota subsp. sativus]
MLLQDIAESFQSFKRCAQCSHHILGRNRCRFLYLHFLLGIEVDFLTSTKLVNNGFYFFERMFNSGTRLRIPSSRLHLASVMCITVYWCNVAEEHQVLGQGINLQVVEESSMTIENFEAGSNLKENSSILLGKKKGESFSDSMKGRKKYRDIDARQASFESAAYASVVQIIKIVQVQGRKRHRTHLGLERFGQREI